MKKLVYLFPATLLAALALPACGDDTTAADTDGNDTGSTSEDPTSMTAPATTVTPTTEPTTEPTTGPSTTDPTIDPDSGSTDPGGCSIDDGDECEGSDDCGAGADCVACFCVDDPDVVCADGWGPEGTYGDCAVDGNEICGGGGDLQTSCGVGPGEPPEYSVCIFLGCDSECDCPEPPEGFEDQVACEDNFGDAGGLNECVISCGPEECPDGMFCNGGVCWNGEEPPPPGEIPEYGDCLNNTTDICAEMGQCLSDGETFGACGEFDCTDATDCTDAPPTGTAEPACTEFPDGSESFCSLLCTNGETCPDGMFCLDLAIGGEGVGSHCTWGPPVPEGFADCASQADAVCGPAETCVEVSTKDASTEVCAASGCVDPTTDCPMAPETGDAPIACLDIDGEKGMECVLDCSADQTCPDDAICTAEGYCAYEAPVTTFEEDFEGGELPEGWVVQNVDGLTPNAGVALVDDAWVVTDAIDGPNFWIMSTSWYTPAGQSDDWIISPAVTLGATAFLRWAARATDPGFPDGYQVFVVPTSVTEFTDFIGDGDPTAFLATTPVPVFEVAGESAELQFHEVDLAALATQEVHIAFRNNSDDMNLLIVDEIRVVE